MRFHTLIAALVAVLLLAPGVLAEWDVRSDTWVATDALGRALPGYSECGAPRADRTVGIFYFLWLGQHGTGGPFDITKILAANPKDPQWGPVGAFHHWSESEVGYYLSDDEWVIRRHCRMLTDAGIDVIILDVTNAFTYDQNVMKLCRIYTQIRHAGGKTPQMCFMANSFSDSTVTRLYNNVYRKRLYPDLWFRWMGKPLVLAAPGDMSPEIKDFFTFRQSWAWHDPNGWYGDGKDKWPWLDHYPQGVGWHVQGVNEMTSVSVAQHPTTNIGRSFHDGNEPAPADRRPDEGLCFAEQAKYALKVDPQFVFVTGWNEWAAQRFLAEGKYDMFLGRKQQKGETLFVDTYSQEYSRDIEPMKGGHNDNYYYQMIDFVRKYKGVRAPEKPSKPKTIRIDGDFSDWADVGPEYRDHIGDTLHRDSVGWGSAGKYVDKTGRNDFVRCKVARDSKYIYFYAETKDPISKRTDPGWMVLLIDSDQNAKTGLMGYDFVVNYESAGLRTTDLTRIGNGRDMEKVRDIPYKVRGNRIELRLPRADIGKSGKASVALDFHWADNPQLVGGKPDFSGSWDNAPERRFNYRYGGTAAQ